MIICKEEIYARSDPDDKKFLPDAHIRWVHRSPGKKESNPDNSDFMSWNVVRQLLRPTASQTDGLCHLLYTLSGQAVVEKNASPTSTRESFGTENTISLVRLNFSKYCDISFSADVVQPRVHLAWRVHRSKGSYLLPQLQDLQQSPADRSCERQYRPTYQGEKLNDIAHFRLCMRCWPPHFQISADARY